MALKPGPLLRQATAALRAGRFERAAAAARQVVARDPRSGPAWRILGVCRERDGDFNGALQAYGAAHDLVADPELSKDLARIALKVGLPQAAEQLLAGYLLDHPGAADALTNLGIAQREQMKFDLAVETLGAALQAHPENALLWSTLATTLAYRGEPDRALVFYDEALRLAPDLANARFQRAKARQACGLSEGVVAAFDQAIPHAENAAEAAALRVARAHALLAFGELGRGWDAYGARRDPAYGDGADFLIEAPFWTPDQSLAGRLLLVVAEQGLGDEVMFAQALGDLAGEIGPHGRLILAVEPRLVALFARSFPQAEVGAHQTFLAAGRNARSVPFMAGRLGEIDAWTTLAEPLARLRRTLQSFEGAGPYLTPRPERIAHWRGWLSSLGPATSPGPTIGISWKSLVMDAERTRWFAPFEAWTPILRTPGARLVRLQPGDCAAETAAAEALGLQLCSPPGLDLREDLDDLTALCVALDAVVGPANATTNLAGAAGARLWLISTPGAWPRLGTDRYPWYPQARVFTPDQLGRWPELMARLAEALGAALAAGRSPTS